MSKIFLKRFCKIALCLLLILSSVSTFVLAQGKKVEQVTSSASYFTFTDDLSRSVEIEKPLSRIAPAGHPANVILLTFDPNLMVGLSAKLPTNTKMFSDGIKNKPVFGAFYGKKADLNKEAVIAADPKIVIDIGEIKGSKESMADDLNKLAEQIGINTVFISNYLKDSGHTYRRLGELLNMKDRGEQLANYADKAVRFANNVKDNITRERTYYYSVSNDGLQGYPQGSFHTEALDAVGGKNILDKSFSEGNNQVSLEQIILLNPDVIFLGNKDAYNIVMDKNGPWRSINAVKNNEVYVVPQTLYSWIDSPPSVNRLLGIYYAASILYPKVANINIKEEAKNYFKLFYNYDISDAELDVALVK